MVGATAIADGVGGTVPTPVAGEQTYFLRGDGTWAAVAAGGDVVGPASATDEAIALYDGTTGKLIKNSSVTVDGSGNIATSGTVDGVDISAHAADADAHHTRYTDTEAQNAVDYAGRFEAASISTGDIGLNKWGWWWDTVNSRLVLVRNRAGVLYAVETTTL
jgi:hypothetical protein